MKLIAGVDIGNSTTEAAIASVDEGGHIRFLSEYSCATTGIKSEPDNIHGIVECLTQATAKLGRKISDLALIRLNEASPVIGDTLVQPLTQTVITDSAMIGHNPSTPAGQGVAVGILTDIGGFDRIGGVSRIDEVSAVIAVADRRYGYEAVAGILNEALTRSRIKVTGLILESDEAVLVYNRLCPELKDSICIIDEVRRIELVPMNRLAAIEVAPVSYSVTTLSNPYGIASLLDLTPEQTRSVIHMAKAFIGKRSGVVIKSASEPVTVKAVDLGRLSVQTEGGETLTADLGKAADAVMKAVDEAHRRSRITDITGKAASQLKERHRISTDAAITDMLAVDTTIKMRVNGGLFDEMISERAIGLAAMARLEALPMQRIAEAVMQKTGVYTQVAGNEAAMAAIGSLTTPGVALPLTVLDLGGGSTDVSHLSEDGTVSSICVAGAGELVTKLIDAELGTASHSLAELIKRYPAAYVESLFHIRMENGRRVFFNEPLNPRLFASTVLMNGEELIPINDIPMERVVAARREAKCKVFVRNAIRALRMLAHDMDTDIAAFRNIVLVGGSSMDFEIPQMLTEAFADYGIVCGRANIRRTLGPRNAVATGLVIGYA